MKKTNYKKDIKDIKRVSNNIPNLMESINFAPQHRRDMHEEAPMHDDAPMVAEHQPDGKEVVDQIRKMALKAMARLADNTEDSYYEILKKVWQMCDKKPEDQKMKKSEEQ